MTKTKVEIQLLLPDLPRQDKCIERLRGLIESKHGIGKVHIQDLADTEAGRICIHFDPSVISLGKVRQLAIQAGTQVSDRYGHLLLKTNSTDVRKARCLADQLLAIKGVLDAGVSADGVVRIEFQREMTDGTKVRQAIERLGISVLKNLSTATEFSADGQSEHENNPATVQHADHDHGDAKDGHNREGAHDHHHGGIFRSTAGGHGRSMPERIFSAATTLCERQSRRFCFDVLKSTFS